MPIKRAPHHRVRKNPTPPDWYPLPIYKKVVLDTSDWVDAIARRILVRDCFEADQDKEGGQRLFKSLIVDEECPDFYARWLGSMDSHSIRKPVDMLSLFEVSYIHALLKKIENPTLQSMFSLSEKIVDDPSLFYEFEDVIRDPSLVSNYSAMIAADLPIGKDMPRVLDYRVPISVDLNSDDKTLLTEFSAWLEDTRRVTKAPKRMVSKQWIGKGPADFADLYDSLIPAFDLTLWGRLTGESYTDADIGWLLWEGHTCVVPPGRSKKGEVSSEERYKDSVKTKLDLVFNYRVFEQLRHQVAFEKIAKR